jgi:hypothetical protein
MVVDITVKNFDHEIAKFEGIGNYKVVGITETISALTMTTALGTPAGMVVLSPGMVIKYKPVGTVAEVASFNDENDEPVSPVALIN